MGMNDFDEWMNRPTYVVQCCTRRIAVEMFPENAGMFRFRSKPEYRNDASRALRTAVALKVREMRRTGELTRESMRKAHKERVTRIGDAWLIDMETETRAIAERDPEIAAAVAILSRPDASLMALPGIEPVSIQDVFPRRLVPTGSAEAMTVLVNRQTMEHLRNLDENPEGEP